MKTRIHDGIVGAVILITIYLGHSFHHNWFWVPTIIAALMVQSAFTGFCPVYFLLGKMCKDKNCS